jgi:hypothetical protein
MPYIDQYTFKLNDIPQANTFLELFDMYKINGIQQKITWIQNGNGLVNQNPNCQVVIVKDYDGQSGATTSTWNQLLERSNAKVRNLQFGTTRNSVKTYITPKIANTVWNTGIASGYSAPKGKQWIDCGSPQVPHYSIVAGINAYQGNNPPDPAIQGSFTFQIETTYYLSFKQVR